MKEKIKKSAHYFIAPGIVLFIFLVLLILKKIYPFGDNLIGSVNIDDIFIPMFYKMYDILHGTADFFFDFKLTLSYLPCTNLPIYTSLDKM